MNAPSSAIESTLVENRVFFPNPELAKSARISSMDAYQALCAEAEKDFEGFWARLARENLSWKKPCATVAGGPFRLTRRGPVARFPRR